MYHIFTSRSKAVTNLFPMPLTPSRRLIENLLNNKNDNSSDAINLEKINSFVHCPSSSSLSSEEIDSHLREIVDLLAGPAFRQSLSSEVKKRMAENPKQKSMPCQIIE